MPELARHHGYGDLHADGVKQEPEGEDAGGERKSRFCRNTYVSADPIFDRFGASGRAKTALALAPEGVERSNVKMGKGFLCSFLCL